MRYSPSLSFILAVLCACVLALNIIDDRVFSSCVYTSSSNTSSIIWFLFFCIHIIYDLNIVWCFFSVSEFIVAAVLFSMLYVGPFNFSCFIRRMSIEAKIQRFFVRVCVCV